MISVGSNDGRKWSGLGLEMGGETEVEEGEALYNQDKNEDSTIDPDVSLSYIEEKLQNVLGHFQKDFEGGISAENLGAKFGEYGSFLPTYHRSPSWSHTRSTPEVHNCASSRSPQKLHSEDHRQNSFASSVGNSLKVTPRHAEKSTSKCGVVKKSLNLSDQRTLKVRIKVGSENFPAQKNDDIYTGLGLVVSPSSSLDDSPVTSEGLCDKLSDVPDESPTSILQIMTSRSWGPILSPLSEDLIYLTERRKLNVNSESIPLDNTRIESSRMLRIGSQSSRSNQEVLEKKKPRLSEKDDALSIELTKQKYNNTVSLLKKEKETDIDILGCEELVSHALKLPLLSSSQHTVSVSKGRKTLSAEPTDHTIKLVVSEDGLKRASDNSSTEGKRKQKGFRGTHNQVTKDQLIADSSVTSKSAKSSNVNGSRHPQKDHLKYGDRYKEFFGDVQSEEEDDESVSGDRNIKRSFSEHYNTSKERHNIKSSANTRPQEKYPKVGSHVAPPLRNGLSSEVRTGMIPPDKEDWVLCDKCKTWRLLPLGINPDKFPDKWICSMLNWLPGMNRCGISEDETTNAVRTLYNQPAPAPAPSSESQHDRVNSSVRNLVGVASVDARYPGQETAENNGKKKPGSTNAEKSTHLDVPTHSSNSQKKNCQTSRKNIDVYQKVSLDNCSDIGTNLKIRSQRESDLDGPRASKRIKGEENNLTSDSGEAFSKTGRGSTSGLSHNASRNDRDTIGSGRNPEINVLETAGDGLIRSSKSDDKNSVRKRKEKEYRSSQIHTEPQLMEKMCADEHRKEKKARLSKSGPANSSSSKVSGSHKNRTTVQEVEGSPVESVSSSPLRYSNSNTDNGGNDRKGMVKKESVSTINDHGTDQSQKQGSHLKKSMKGLSSCPKDMDPTGPDIDKEKLKTSEFSHDSLNHKHSYKEKSTGERDKPDEKSSTPRKSDKFIFKKDAIGGTLSEGSKEQIQKESKSHDKRRHNIQKEHEDEKLHKISDRVEIYGNGKSNSLPPLARVQTENGLKVSAVDAFNNGDSSKAPNVSNQPMGLRHPTPDSDKARDIEASSPVRRDSSSHAAHVMKEGKALKRLADRLKNSESADSIGLYFQATLKFLHGASLFESRSSEILHSVHTYSSTAKLLEFCAHEFEKSKDMAAAALAYKCMEVAYMRVVYSARASASRDQNELQTALQIVPPGESPSSSASDLDNLNHQANIDKAALAKAIDSPQVSGGHIITSRNRSSLSRIIDFAQNVNHAMEASRKSRIAFTSATSGLGETSNHESLNSLKKALDFNFSDVEGLLRLVRIAMEAINR